MKNKYFTFVACARLFYGNAQNEDRYTILLSGASFAEPNNKWFEMGCRALEAVPVNRAVSSESIANTANRMVEGTLYSSEELDEIDVFVIMQVHDKDVFHSDHLKENYKDYALPFDASDYAACYDYVIKRYISECYNLKFNPMSKYYNSPYGNRRRLYCVLIGTIVVRCSTVLYACLRRNGGFQLLSLTNTLVFEEAETSCDR